MNWLLQIMPNTSMAEIVPGWPSSVDEALELTWHRPKNAKYKCLFRSRFVINLCSFEVEPKVFRPKFDKKFIPIVIRWSWLLWSQFEDLILWIENCYPSSLILVWSPCPINFHDLIRVPRNCGHLSAILGSQYQYDKPKISQQSSCHNTKFKYSMHTPQRQSPSSGGRRWWRGARGGRAPRTGLTRWRACGHGCQMAIVKF